MTTSRGALPGMTTQVFVRDGLLDRAACAAVRAAMDAAPQGPAEIFRGGYLVDEGVRRSIDVAVNAATLTRVQDAIATLAPSLSSHFRLSLSGFEGVGLLRYLPGGFYRPHRDVLPGSTGLAARQVSVVLFLGGTAPGESAVLDGQSVGGALRVFTDASADNEGTFIDVLPHEGRVVAFPARLLHEVRPVMAGIRDVAVDWGIGE